MIYENTADQEKQSIEESLDERFARTDRALEGLLNLIEENAKWRRIYRLHYTAPMTIPELAKSEKLPERTVRHIISEIIKKAIKYGKKIKV